MPGTLYVVATPIGNLSDVTDRAKETFAIVDAILCEDTRVTAKLMSHLGLKKPLVSYHQHSAEDKTREILERLRAGKSLALVTDAGTPGISDPGGKLVEAVVGAFGNEAVIVPIPGPSALAAALSVCGFPSDKFTFLGFPPHKKGRNAYFDRVAAEEGTVVFYESTHRILKTLEALTHSTPDRDLCVCRELTKLHETMYRGTAKEVTNALESSSIKGEFVIVIAPV